MATPFPVADWRVHVLRNWRRSAEAWDKELREILSLPRASGKAAPPPPPPAAIASAAELWQHYFARRRGDAGIGFEGGVMPEWRLVRADAPTLTNALLSLIATQRPDFVAYPLSKGKMWHHSRLFLGNAFLLQKQEELDAVVELAAAEWEKFPAALDRLEMTDFLAYWEKKDKHQAPLAEQLLFCLPKLWRDARTPQGALRAMTNNCGWAAILEGGPGTTWETCKRALQRKIPVVLQHRDGDGFRLAVAYLTHDDRRLLLDADFTRLAQEAPLASYSLPETLPAGMDVIEFNPAEWTPWLIHHFAPTVEHLRPRMLDIFNSSSL